MSLRGTLDAIIHDMRTALGALHAHLVAHAGAFPPGCTPLAAESVACAFEAFRVRLLRPLLFAAGEEWLTATNANSTVFRSEELDAILRQLGEGALIGKRPRQ